MPKDNPQALGSALTYARRYALCAMLSILTKDDDGEAAIARSAQQQQPRQQTTRTPVARQRSSEPPPLPSSGSTSDLRNTLATLQKGMRNPPYSFGQIGKMSDVDLTKAIADVRQRTTA